MMFRLAPLLCITAVIGGLCARSVRANAPADPSVDRTVMIGRSVDGRPIRVVETGDPDSVRKTLVVGCIHGNERAGIAVADRLAAMAGRVREADLWIHPT